ncbi:magnesium transporter [Candidatus Cyanaurora vandensis]|uniref:magnesium transporter n=1 Tax=Candidatus Cyanaurora vandensis TaxID=2714958 RepID=UPI00257D9F11|nr:magnesium transporter [Candidatus Cyanaurora vandensis]
MLTEDRHAVLSSIASLGELKAQLNALNPVDASDYLSTQPPDRQAIAFRLLDKEQANEVFGYLPLEVQEELVTNLHKQEVRTLVEAMTPDDRAEFFDELPARVVKRLLLQLSPSEREATALLLGYPEHTAGRVMTTEYVRLRMDLTVAQAIQKIRRLDADKETIYYCYLTDPDRVLQGVVSLRQLIFADPETPIQELAQNRLISVNTNAEQEAVARLMKRYDLLALPVVDRDERLVGIVTIDDVVDIIEESATEDLQKLSGIQTGDESTLDSPLVSVQKRLPWLVGNVLLYVGVASLIAPFQEVIGLVPVLAVIMPIIANTSGNTAIQTLAVTVRGLGVGEIVPQDLWKVVRKEVLAGLCNALVLGVVLGSLSLIWSYTTYPRIALVAAGVIAINVLVAAAAGTILPITLKRLGLDPALISGPLLTTLLDSIGFLTFLGTTSLLLKHGLL